MVTDQIHSRTQLPVLAFAASVIVFVVTWGAATWLIGFGLWVLVFGDDGDSKWYWSAPIAGGAIAIVATACFRYFSRRGLWFAFGLSLVLIFACFFAGWGMIVFVDEGL